ncbi:hypothetical protein KXD93_16765 [Mucilaginibacter sp. BJC16-A38]|uniref:hypothetical protein n=1 Tax=Mucilaginibacter phenanthrenivorans TaxID=1234842 RepID=UPI0021584473|nr:hypothetical protein [Mucilaginibacter phenanthrenivorans]MCR8559312.1 hypothetical protein [Mucilaginibacter phenanthrenivorans]
MIVILSFDYFEQGTDPVIEWLLYYNVPFVKIAVEDLLHKRHNYFLDVNKGRLFVNGVDITDDVEVIFYRRFYRYLQFEPKETLGDISKKIHIESNKELEEIVDFLYVMFQSKVWLPKPARVNVNKLEISFIAHRLGIKTPYSVITNNKTQLREYFNQTNKNLITKAINRLSYYTFGKYTYNTYTTKITDDIIDSLPEKFFPTLFQEAIIAKYEIRVFYLDGMFYATAAVTSSRRREVDIKRSFNNNDLHWIPYLLPDQLMDQIKKLMIELDLITGSMDLILDKSNTYHFIEVNPVGQYLAPSSYCNYYIEKIIAEWLITKNNRQRTAI